MMHPYKSFPDRAFWSRSISNNRNFEAFYAGDRPLLRRSDKIASAGSCFAANLIARLEGRGFHYIRTEFLSSIYNLVPKESLAYATYSAAYGNIYTMRQMRQLLERAFGIFKPAEDRIYYGNNIIDVFRPGMSYHASSDLEFNALQRNHFRAIRRVIEECSIFIFTLGLTEAWLSKADGAVYPVCPGTIAGQFDSKLHSYHNFDAEEIFHDFSRFLEIARSVNKDFRVLLTISPVPLVATASGKHVATANALSKATLLYAVSKICSHFPDVLYFPSYEIVSGPQSEPDFFEQDRRTVSPRAISVVMDSFLSVCEPAGTEAELWPAESQSLPNEQLLSRLITRLECEEEAQLL